MRELGLALLGERRHAFLLVGRGEQLLEQAALEVETFLERELVGFQVSTRCRINAGEQLTSQNGLLAGLNADLAKRRNLLGDLDSLVDYALALADDAADETPLTGFSACNLTTGENEVHGALGSDKVGQTLGTTCTWNDTECNLGLREGSIGCAEKNIAHHGELATSTELEIRSDLR